MQQGIGVVDAMAAVVAEQVQASLAVDRQRIDGLGSVARQLQGAAVESRGGHADAYDAAAGRGPERIASPAHQVHYLAMRQGLIEFNQRHRDLLSNDLGAVAGLMFDLGMERYPLPPAEGDAKATDAWAKDLAAVREETAAFAKQLDKNRVSDEGHTEVQGWLRDLGLALGFSVWIASNDQSRPYNGGRLADGCLTVLPQALQNEGADAVRLIDVIWLERESGTVVAAFEVEHTTSIYSGIVRLLDLALSGGAAQRHHLFLVAPDEREADVRQQVLRPAFSQVRELNIRYLPYGELRQHREAIARFGVGIKPVEAIARMF